MSVEYLQGMVENTSTINQLPSINCQSNVYYVTLKGPDFR